MNRFPALPLALATCLVANPAAAQPLSTSPRPAPPERVALTCTEQPYHEVIFGDAGQVNYQEHPPKRTGAVTVTVERPPASADAPVDRAIIRSEDPDLASDTAAWLTATRLDAQQGRLKLDLAENMLTLTEADSAGQARFRRFQCQPVAPPTE